MGSLKPEEVIAYVFLDIAIVLVAARLVGALFKRIRQPAVVGEILAGLLLGKSLLGNIPWPSHARHLDQVIFPDAARLGLSSLANLGLIIFMFIVGLELNTKLIRGNERRAGVISVSSVVLPFALGLLLAQYLYTNHHVIKYVKDGVLKPNPVPSTAFALFIGASMSVTAFPVLARILTERNMHRTPLGVLALACAAVDDIIAWSLLAAVTAVAEMGKPSDTVLLVVESLAYLAFMGFVVRRGLKWLAEAHRRAGRLTPDILAAVLVGVLLSSYITDRIGIHFIFGAFVFGVTMPRGNTVELFEEILQKLEQVSVLLLLPLFFVVTGFSVDVTKIGKAGPAELGLILLVACAGKFLGAAAGARLQRLPGRTAAAVGILMNTRGLTELVILKIGLDKHVLDGQLFSMLVVMAVVTTVMTEPILRLVYPDRLVTRDVAVAERAALGIPEAYRVLVAIKHPADGGRLCDVGVQLIAGEHPAEIVVSQFRPQPKASVEVGSGLVGELAEMAASLDVLNALAVRARAAGVPAAVLSRFGDDVAGDLLAQVRTVEADVVLLGSDEPPGLPLTGVAARLVTDAECQVVVLHSPLGELDGLTGPVRYVGAGGRDSEAALLVAIRMAWSRGGRLHLVDPSGGRRHSRRVAQLLERLGRVGVDVSIAELSDPAVADATYTLVQGLTGEQRTGSSAASSAPHSTVLVRGAADAEGSDLDRLLERLENQPSPHRTEPAGAGTVELS